MTRGDPAAVQDLDGANGNAVRQWSLAALHESYSDDALLFKAKDCTQALALIDGLEGAYLLADRSYDTNAIVEQARSQGMLKVIPSKRNRKEKREHDRDIYKERHQVGNAFLHLKQWRGIATKYANNTASFVAAVQIRSATLWAAIL